MKGRDLPTYRHDFEIIVEGEDLTHRMTLALTCLFQLMRGGQLIDADGPRAFEEEGRVVLSGVLETQCPVHEMGDASVALLVSNARRVPAPAERVAATA